MKRTNLILFLFLLFSLLVLFILYFFYPQKFEQQYSVELFTLEDIPVVKNNGLLDQNLNLSAVSAYALDLSSMTVLYDKNADLVLYPASTSKMVSALVTVDNFALDQELQVAKEATVAGNKLSFKEGELVRVDDLLAALLIFSANDSAYILANNYPTGLSGFVEQMNEKVKNLGLRSSHFVNPAGLDEDGQQSSARDLTIIAKELIKNQRLKQLVATPYKKISNQSQNWSYDLYNNNQLLGRIQGVAGVKTGTTELAGEVLVTLIERDGHQILMTLMNSQDRYQDTSKLIAWILNNYEWKKL